MEGDICEELKSIKDLINRQHLACKGTFISTQIMRLDNKKANTILKRHVYRLKGVEVNSKLI